MHAFRIGRIFGIDVRVDWSWVFIFVLMTWNLFAVFSRWHPAWSPFEGGAVAVAATLLFFGCIVLHELAHSVVAMGSRRPSVAALPGSPTFRGPAGSDASGSHDDERPIPRGGAHPVA